jgi:outer membrane receptor protein involved in Fe transport
VKYLQVSNTLTNTFKQQIVSAYVTGPVATLPAGDLSTVFGAEYRGFRYNLDPGAAGGPISGFNVQDPAGGTNRFEDLFTEAFIPLVKDAGFAKAIDLTLGYRYSKSRFRNQISGTEESSANNSAYKMELSWLPIDTLRLRGSYQRAVRAPNFTELFDGGGSNPQYYDPCSATSAARNGANAAKILGLCRTAGELGAAGWGGDTFVQTPGTQISTTLGPNVLLKPEKADTFTLGVVFQPEEGVLSKLRTSVDYYKIDVKDALINPDANLYVADCYNFYGRNPNYDPNYVNCQGIFRSGNILGVDNPATLATDGFFIFQNDGKIKTDGIDVQLNWLGTDIGPGKFTATLYANYLLSWKQQATSDLPQQDFAGTITFFGAGDGLGQTFPDLRATLYSQYRIREFGIDVRTRYIDSMDNRAAVLYPSENFKGVGSVVYWDIGGSWNFSENSTVRIGVNNVTDKQPPQYDPNVQSGTDPSTYDVIGRRYFARFDVKF